MCAPIVKEPADDNCYLSDKGLEGTMAEEYLSVVAGTGMAWQEGDSDRVTEGNVRISIFQNFNFNISKARGCGCLH